MHVEEKKITGIYTVSEFKAKKFRNYVNSTLLKENKYSTIKPSVKMPKCDIVIEDVDAPKTPSLKKQAILRRYPAIVAVLAVVLFALPCGMLAMSSMSSNASELVLGQTDIQETVEATPDSNIAVSTSKKQKNTKNGEKAYTHVLVVDSPQTTPEITNTIQSDNTVEDALVIDNIVDEPVIFEASDDAAAESLDDYVTYFTAAEDEAYIEETIAETSSTTEQTIEQPVAETANNETVSTPVVENTQTVEENTTADVAVEADSTQPEQNVEEAQPVEEAQDHTQAFDAVVSKKNSDVRIVSKDFTVSKQSPKKVELASDDYMTEAESTFAHQVFDAYNNWRAEQGLPQVAWSENCAAMAYACSVKCADQCSLTHQLGIPEQLKTKYSDILQYSNWALSADEAIHFWEESHGHRQMMTCETVTEAACAVYHRGDDWYFAIVYDFQKCNIGK